MTTLQLVKILSILVFSVGSVVSCGDNSNGESTLMPRKGQMGRRCGYAYKPTFGPGVNTHYRDKIRCERASGETCVKIHLRCDF